MEPLTSVVPEYWPSGERLLRVISVATENAGQENKWQKRFSRSINQSNLFVKHTEV